MLALLDAYTKGVTEAQPDPIFTEYMQSDFNSLQIWTPDGSDLVSQVMYLPSGKTLVCHLAIQPPHKDHILATFPKFFQDRMVQTVKFLQAYINASRHSTTAARFHYSQTQDFSNISPKEAVSFFPYLAFLFLTQASSPLFKSQCRIMALIQTSMVKVLKVS